MNTDKRLRELIDAERSITVPRRVSARGWARLVSAVALGTPAMAIAQATIPVTTAWMVAEGAAIALVVGAVGTAAIVGLGPSRTTVAPKVVASSAAAGVRAEGSARAVVQSTASCTSSVPDVAGPSMARFADEQALPHAAPEPTAASPLAPTAVRAAAWRGSVESPVHAVSAPVSDLEVELRLIAHAKSEIDRGQPQAAVAWLDEHQARFPGGVMSAERDGLRVLMVCANATTEVARVRVAQYAVRYPGSPLLDRIRRACEKDDRE